MKTLDEYPATSQVRVRIREHDVVSPREIRRKSREIGGFQSHVNLRQNRLHDLLLVKREPPRSRSFLLKYRLTRRLNSAQLERVTVRLNLWSSVPTSLNPRRNSSPNAVCFNEIFLGFINARAVVGNYLVFHYACEFVDTIRETEPMQFRNQIRGALGKAAHYRDIPSKANICRVSHCIIVVSTFRSRFFGLN